MADIEVAPTSEQHSIELPNGAILSGMGGDVEAITEQAEERHEELHPDPAVAAVPAVADPVPAVEEPKKTRGQKRFDQLTAERETEKRRADAAEARTKELEAKLAPPLAAAVVPVVAASETKYTRPEPTEEEVGTKYAKYSDFTKDQALWVWEQQETKLRADLDAQSKASIEDDRASRTRAQTYDNAYKAGRAVYSDFDAVLNSAADIPIPLEYAEAISHAPNLEHILYGLGKDRAGLQHLLTIKDALQFGLELSKFMPRESVAPPASTAPVVRTTNAPAPPQPVGAGSRTTSLSVEEAALTGDLTKYRIARGLRQL